MYLTSFGSVATVCSISVLLVQEKPKAARHEIVYNMKALDVHSKDLGGVSYLDEAGNYLDGGVVDVPQLDEISLLISFSRSEEPYCTVYLKERGQKT